MEASPHNIAGAPHAQPVPHAAPAPSVVFPPGGVPLAAPVIGKAAAPPPAPHIGAPPMAPPYMAPPLAPPAAPPMAHPAPPAPPLAHSAAPIAPPLAPPVAPPAAAPAVVSGTPSTIAPPPPASSKTLVNPSKIPGISRVPSMPALFDNEFQRSEEEESAIDDKKWPEIILEPLHVLDPLCVKWHLDKLSVPVITPTEQEPVMPPPAPAPAPVAAPAASSAPASGAPVPLTSLPSSSRLANGYLRLLGLLYNGSPWDFSIPMGELSRQGGVTIGRARESCNVVLPENSISRCHLRIELTDVGVVVTDQRTTNGTFLDGRRLEPYEQQVPIKDGSILTLGDITLRVEILPPALSPYSM